MAQILEKNNSIVWTCFHIIWFQRLAASPVRSGSIHWGKVINLYETKFKLFSQKIFLTACRFKHTHTTIYVSSKTVFLQV